MERWLGHVPDDVPVHYVVLRPSREVALQRAVGRTGKTDLIDEEPVTFMHQAFVEQGGSEDHILDSSRSTAEETASEILRLVSERRLLLR
jgi:hypothetical protein